MSDSDPLNQPVDPRNQPVERLGQPLDPAGQPVDPAGPDGPKPPSTRGRTIAIVILSIAAAILIGVIIWLLVANGSAPSPTPSPTPTATPTPTPSPTATAAPGTCTTAELAVTLGTSQGAAGSSVVPIVFTNRSTAACTLTGYPTVQFVGKGNGTTIGTAADNDPTTSPITQTLQPGGAVTAQLRVGDAENFSGCTVVTPDGFRIAPPQASDTVFVAMTTLQACDNPDIHQLAVQAVAH